MTEKSTLLFDDGTGNAQVKVFPSEEHVHTFLQSFPPNLQMPFPSLYITLPVDLLLTINSA